LKDAALPRIEDVEGSRKRLASLFGFLLLGVQGFGADPGSTSQS
jgi:hypothetical protein